MHLGHAVSSLVLTCVDIEVGGFDLGLTLPVPSLGLWSLPLTVAHTGPSVMRMCEPVCLPGL